MCCCSGTSCFVSKHHSRCPTAPVPKWVEHQDPLDRDVHFNSTACIWLGPVTAAIYQVPTCRQQTQLIDFCGWYCLFSPAHFRVTHILARPFHVSDHSFNWRFHAFLVKSKWMKHEWKWLFCCCLSRSLGALADLATRTKSQSWKWIMNLPVVFSKPLTFIRDDAQWWKGRRKREKTEQQITGQNLAHPMHNFA